MQRMASPWCSPVRVNHAALRPAVDGGAALGVHEEGDGVARHTSGRVVHHTVDGGLDAAAGPHLHAHK